VVSPVRVRVSPLARDPCWRGGSVVPGAVRARQPRAARAALRAAAGAPGQRSPCLPDTGLARACKGPRESPQSPKRRAAPGGAGQRGRLPWRAAAWLRPADAAGPRLILVGSLLQTVLRAGIAHGGPIGAMPGAIESMACTTLAAVAQPFAEAKPEVHLQRPFVRRTVGWLGRASQRDGRDQRTAKTRPGGPGCGRGPLRSTSTPPTRRRRTWQQTRARNPRLRACVSRPPARRRR
jgi:hypothetical protein